MFVSMGLMLAGVLIYSAGCDVTHVRAIFWVFMNNFFAIGDRLLQRLMLASDQSPVDISKTGVTLLNNLLGLIPMVPVMYLTGELTRAPQHLSELGQQPFAICVVVASCLVGVGIGYAGVWAQSLISATSFLVLVNVNKFAIIFVEVAVLKSKVLAPVQLLGCVIAILSGVWYARAKDQLDSKEDEEDLEAKAPLMKRDHRTKGSKV